MQILVINSGSSSIKYRLFEKGRYSVLAYGVIERINHPGASAIHRYRFFNRHDKEQQKSLNVPDHRVGLACIINMMVELGVLRNADDLYGIGHRVVHGGEAFHEPVLIDDEVLEAIRVTIPLAPLHNPANLAGIEAVRQHFPGVPQVAVFDTAFHQTMPPHAYRYAVPDEFYTRYHIRRYGFHGTSHQYVAGQAARHLGQPLERLNLITLHLGNGASVTAVQAGKSIDTSMGMTPMEGLMMGSRCGDIDPALHFYLSRTTGIALDELERLFNESSGLRGICGKSDMREVHRLAEAGDDRADLAVRMYCYRIKKYIGAYIAALGRVDAIVFTGGVGENDRRVRHLACEGLEAMGILMDNQKNRVYTGGIKEIHASQSVVRILIVPTDEELAIAQCVARTVVSTRGA